MRRGQKINNLCSLICLTWLGNRDTLPHTTTPSTSCLTIRAMRARKEIDRVCAPTSRVTSSHLSFVVHGETRSSSHALLSFTSFPLFRRDQAPPTASVLSLPLPARYTASVTADCMKRRLSFRRSKFEIYLFRFNYHVHDGCHSETPLMGCYTGAIQTRKSRVNLLVYVHTYLLRPPDLETPPPLPLYPPSCITGAGVARATTKSPTCCELLNSRMR